MRDEVEPETHRLLPFLEQQPLQVVTAASEVALATSSPSGSSPSSSPNSSGPQAPSSSSPHTPSSSSTSTRTSTSSKKGGKQKLETQHSSEGLGICRICLEEDDLSQLETPCSCSGTQRYAHHACIQTWIIEKGNKRCEICGHLYRGAYTVPPPQPSIPEDSPFGNAAPFPMFVVPAEVRLREAMAASQQGRGFLDDEEGSLYASRHPKMPCWFIIMVFFMFLVLHRILGSSDDYDDNYDSSSNTEDAGAPDTLPPAPDHSSADEDFITDALLFVLWVAAKALLIGIPLFIVMRIAARQAARERYEAMQMAQLGRGRIVLRFQNADASSPQALVRPGIV